MGDRANIVVRETWPNDLGDSEAVFLYTHWSGTELPEVLRRALAKRWRWNDPPYLARVVFEEMIAVYPATETGFGVSTRLGDNEYDLLVLREERVYLLSESAYNESGFSYLDATPSCSFAEYAEASEPITWEAVSALAKVVAS